MEKWRHLSINFLKTKISIEQFKKIKSKIIFKSPLNNN
jgi:hypothetical protein